MQINGGGSGDHGHGYPTSSYQYHHSSPPTRLPSIREADHQKFHYLFLVVGVVFGVQLLFAGMAYNQISEPLHHPTRAFFESSPDNIAVDDNNLNDNDKLLQDTSSYNHTGMTTLLEERLAHMEWQLSSRVAALTERDRRRGRHITYKNDGNFYPFVIRDARRLVPTQIPKGFHIFDYVDLDNAGVDQQDAWNSSLFHNARYIGRAACQQYNVKCYKRKILQVLEFLLNQTSAQYYFYMESDNELCVPLQQVRNLTYVYKKYFISTGIGFSGWIMRRDFLQDFYNAYQGRHKHNNEYPDPLGAQLLMEKKAWTVTRQYLVSHTNLQSVGANALTVSDNSEELESTTTSTSTHLAQHQKKHLPRCFEPRRGVWPISEEDPRDMHGWDYFDYELCPEAEIFPCQPGQLEELTKNEPAVHVSDTFWDPNDMLNTTMLWGGGMFGGGFGAKKKGGAKTIDMKKVNLMRGRAFQRLQQQAQRRQHGKLRGL